MSLKPLKKSDLEKGWMKKRRDKAIRIQPEYHLIVTEGTETEPQYFQAVKDIINRKYRDKIQLDVFGEGDNTLSLFEKAKSRVSQNANGYKHVWIVYDTDDFPADHINRTAELCVQNSGEYSKGRPDMYEILKPYMEIAIANAKRLDQMNAGKPPASSAPGTKVYELIELLKPYLLES